MSSTLHCKESAFRRWRYFGKALLWLSWRFVGPIVLISGAVLTLIRTREKAGANSVSKLWYATIAVSMRHPHVIFALLFSVLFVAIFIVSVLRMIAYMRWTGKYPCYFLFKKSPSSGNHPRASNQNM